MIAASLLSKLCLVTLFTGASILLNETLASAPFGQISNQW